MLKTGTLLGGRYEIIEKIGSGGMSDVYKAKCTVLNRLVAIKVLKAEYSADKEFVAKFRREAQAAAGLSHPNVVSIYDVSEEDDIYYIVMELIEGITLKKYIERKGKMNVREAVEVAMQVAKGLGAAHSQGIVHRDVKPQNIMISREGKIKVTDFGIAHVSATQTIHVNAMGSVHYLSPEQARGGYCDERSDIYSLGVSLFEMLTGHVPFDGDTAVAVALQQIQNEMPLPSSYEPELPSTLDKIVLKCTQKKPELRYGSMELLLEDFRHFLSDPEADFVTLETAVQGGTVVLTARESEMLKHAADKIGAPDRKTDNSEAEPSSEERKQTAKLSAEDSAQEPEKNGERTAAVSAPSEDDEEDDDEEDALARLREKRMENVLKYVMIGVALLILALLIALTFRACGGLFEQLESFGESSQAPTEATQPSETVPKPTESRPGETETDTEPPSESESEDDGLLDMPKLVGMDYMAAAALLNDMGLVAVPQLGTAPTDEFKVLEVYDQQYPEYYRLARGSTVILWVVGSPESVIIPRSLENLSSSEAKKVLNNMGLSVSEEFDWVNSDYISSGRVADTVPPIGSVVDAGSSIRLVLSLGPAPKITVPSLNGMTEEGAMKALKLAGLKPGNVTYACDNDMPEGKIISQLPAAMEQVEADTKIDFVISKGRPLMPDLIGKSVEEAGEILDELGLSIGLLSEDFSSLVEEGLIMDMQSSDKIALQPGDLMRVGDVINLILSKGPETIPMPDILDMPALEAKTWLEDVANGAFKVEWTNGAEHLPTSRDLVVLCSIAPGDPVQCGSTLLLTFGAPVTVPNVFGMSVTEAVSLLEGQGFAVAFENGVLPESPDDAAVMTISPSAAATVGFGRTLTLSFDEDYFCEVPFVQGLSVPEAMVLIYKAGLVPGDVSGYLEGSIVTGTNPGNGTRLGRNSVVEIYFTNPTPPPSTESEATEPSTETESTGGVN